jgi:hypothetical protein
VTTAGPPPDLGEVEAYFRRNGLPHLSDSPEFREQSYSLVSFGVLALLAHQGRPALSGLRATTSVAIRALPPLLAVLLFLSLAQEPGAPSANSRGGDSARCSWASASCARSS